jgi:putative nucleotidyltransferase with HDIG domain
MIKKIHVSRLCLGMFIHDLNCGWMAHKFMRSRFLLTKASDFNKILESGINELYIDNTKGLDADGLTEEEASAGVIQRLEAAVTIRAKSTAHNTFSEELPEATAIYREASEVVASMLADARLGKQLSVDRVRPIVSRIMNSLLRNSGALLSLNRIKAGDKYTFQHSVSVATLMIVFGRCMGLGAEELYQAGLGGIVHDIGKMQVPEKILNKPDLLTDAEFVIMKSHVTLGLAMLKETPDITGPMLEITGQHHERFDGTGYPNGLTAFNISQTGRMAAIVDVYDAITSNRCYHTGMEPAMALKKLFEWSAHHFDEALVQSFIQAVGIYPVGSLVRMESNRLGVVIEQGREGLLYPIVRIIFDISLNRPLEPKDLDLSLPEHGGEAIVSHEQPDAWGINPYDYLTL